VEKRLELTRAAARQIREGLRVTRALKRNTDVFARGAPVAEPVVRGVNVQWLRVTSATPTGNLYPALVQIYNAAHDTWRDAGTAASASVWLRFPDGYQAVALDVSSKVLFEGTQAGPFTDGTPVFLAEGGFTSTVTCPDGTVNVWYAGRLISST